MTDPPQHIRRERPMMCPGSCNPLRAHQHQHHHHHHRHRHHRQKHDAVSGTTSRKDISLLPGDLTSLLLRSLKPDIPVASAISTDDKSISRTSSFSKIALIKVSPRKDPRPKEIDIPGIMQEVLSQRQMEIGESSTSEPPFLRKLDTTSQMKTIPYPNETIARIAPSFRTPRTLENVKCTVTKRLNGLTTKALSSLFLYLIIFIIYAGIHVLFAVITWRTSAYQFFVSSQICGIFAFLMWRITGTILI